MNKLIKTDDSTFIDFHKVDCYKVCCITREGNPADYDAFVPVAVVNGVDYDLGGSGHVLDYSTREAAEDLLVTLLASFTLGGSWSTLGGDKADYPFKIYDIPAKFGTPDTDN